MMKLKRTLMTGAASLALVAPVILSGATTVASANSHHVHHARTYRVVHIRRNHARRHGKRAHVNRKHARRTARRNRRHNVRRATTRKNHKRVLRAKRNRKGVKRVGTPRIKNRRQARRVVKTDKARVRVNIKNARLDMRHDEHVAAAAQAQLQSPDLSNDQRDNLDQILQSANTAMAQARQQFKVMVNINNQLDQSYPSNAKGYNTLMKDNHDINYYFENPGQIQAGQDTILSDLKDTLNTLLDV